MKFTVLALLLLVSTQVMAYDFPSLSQQATYFQSVYGNPSNAYTITQTEMNQGQTRPKAVLKGVYYFGGVDKKESLTSPLSSGYRNLLCGHGFTQAYTVYNAPTTSTSCSKGTMEYTRIAEAAESADGGPRVKAMMQKIHEIIKADGKKGPIYLHCAYGVHASNTISQMVLKQFCGISDEEASRNWDRVNYANSLGATGVAKQKAKIRAFRPDPALSLTAEERAIVCY